MVRFQTVQPSDVFHFLSIYVLSLFSMCVSFSPNGDALCPYLLMLLVVRPGATSSVLTAVPGAHLERRGQRSSAPSSSATESGDP